MSKPARPAVKSTQELFNALGTTPPLVVDGDWGSKTNAALDTLHQEHVTKPTMAAEKPWKWDVPGIDISAWKPGAQDIDWDKVGQYGFRFAYVKVSQDDNYTSKKFHGHEHGFRQLGCETGAYHFGDYVDNKHHGVEKAARLEAEHFIAKMGLVPFSLAPMLDVESGFDKSDDQANAIFILEFCRIVTEKVGRCGVYTAGWAWDLYLKKAPQDLLDEITKLPVWWARYRSSLDNLRGWDKAHIWQWSGKSKVDGIEKRGKHVLCDRNWSSEQALEQLKL